jgi:hypothetical protein
MWIYIASPLLVAHAKVTHFSQKTLIKSRLNPLCGREARLWRLVLKDNKFGFYLTVSVGSHVAVLKLTGEGVEFLCLSDE